MRTIIFPVLALIVVSLAPSACSDLPATRVAHYDLHEAPPASESAEKSMDKVASKAFPVGSITISSASWLAGTDMHYRLLYADPQRRFRYGEAQWIAPPAELLEHLLVRDFAAAPRSKSVASCRLILALDEMEQRFESPQRSHVQLDVRVSLVMERGDAVLARTLFAPRQSAEPADARGGAAAAGQAARRLQGELLDWLEQLPSNIGERCARQG